MHFGRVSKNPKIEPFLAHLKKCFFSTMSRGGIKNHRIKTTPRKLMNYNEIFPPPIISSLAHVMWEPFWLVEQSWLAFFFRQAVDFEMLQLFCF